MIDDGDEPGGQAPFPRSYDFFKHMTGIALVSIGGVFAFADGAGTRFDRKQLVIVLAFIGLAGVISIVMASYLATQEVKRDPVDKIVRSIRYAQFGTSFLLAGGLGSFIFNFTSAILE